MSMCGRFLGMNGQILAQMYHLSPFLPLWGHPDACPSLIGDKQNIKSATSLPASCLHQRR